MGVPFEGYTRPTDRTRFVKPGPGLRDFMQLPVEPTEKLFKAVTRTIEADRLYPGKVVRTVFRFLGSPRAWQLGGEQVLRKLDETERQWLKKAAAGLLTEITPGHRYFQCAEPQVVYGNGVLEMLPEYDLTNIAVIEQWYYSDTMPIEFVERIATLAESNR